MPYVVSLLTTFKRYSRIREHTVSVDLRKFHVTPSSWLGLVLGEMGRQSAVSRINDGDTRTFLKVMELAVTKLECLEILRTPPRKIDVKTIHRLFVGIENAIEEANRWEFEKNISAIARRTLLRYVNSEAFAEVANAYTINFKTRTRFSNGSRPRSTLSETVDHSQPENLVEPFDALLHDSIEELKKKQNKRLSNDADKYLSAFVEEMQTWERIRQGLIECSCINVSEDQRLEIVAGLFGSEDRQAYAPPPMPFRDFIGCIARYFLEYPTSNLITLTCLSRKVIADGLRQEFMVDHKYLPGRRCCQFIGTVQRMHPRELTAVFCTLLFHTGWNSDALRELQIDWIQEEEDGYLIASHKDKVGKNVPTCYITKENKGGIAAVKRLLWQHESLRALGLISEAEKRLWFGWQKTPSYPLRECVADLTRSIAAICQTHNLERFSTEQIRNHVLTLATYNSGAVEVTQDIASHSRLGNTGHYIDQIATRALNKAINREFQHRLDHTTLYGMQTSGKCVSRKIDQGKIDAKLMFKVGDGTLCSNRSAPPDLRWLTENGECSGQHCHDGQGCLNNKIVLDDERIEEVFRFHHYYRHNWQSLRAKNEKSFEAHHLQPMLFNLALVSFIRKSPYWGQIRQFLTKRGLI